MTVEVEGSFHVTSWDEKTYEELGGDSKLTRIAVVQRYAGELEATASWEGLMFYRSDGTAFYTGLQHFVGRLKGLEGTFVAETRGEFNGEKAMTEWSVVPGSSRGELVGLEGSGTATATADSEGTFTFDFDMH